MKVGLFLSSEEYTARQLLEQARLASEHGLHGLWISDHYHPWLPSQEHSPFTWTVLGAVAHATSRMELATMVTCPTIRYHPAIVAQAAATVGVMSEGRFTLGLGAGETEREIKPLPRKTKKGTSFFYLAGAAIIVISFLSLFFFSKGFQNLKRSLSGAATVEEREGSVVLIASPWAEVREIRNEENEDIPLKGGTVTPSVLKLKPGSYSITLSHPQFGTETVKVRISAGQRVERTIEMFSENPETLLPPLLKEKG